MRELLRCIESKVENNIFISFFIYFYRKNPPKQCQHGKITDPINRAEAAISLLADVGSNFISLVCFFSGLNLYYHFLQTVFF